TAILVAASSVTFVVTSVRAFRNGRGQGLKDFRIQMAIVAWIWLAGEIVELLIRMEPGPTLHMTSMFVFSAFIVLRAKSFLT
ncbi:MAG: hypothetical protein HYZ12_03300, partial [Thaumarchaeota archaeon]|nr:hypothetical protein [Nitrososphaerota archaeon]